MREKNKRGNGYPNQGWMRNTRYAKRVSTLRKIGEKGIQIDMIRDLAMRSYLERVGNVKTTSTSMLTSNERQKTNELKLNIRSNHKQMLKGDLRTICRFSYIKVYKLITLGTKFKTLLSLGRTITVFPKFITNYIEQGWWHSSLTLKCMHLVLKEVNKRGRHAYNLHGWTCLPSGIVMEIHCHITGIFEAAVRLRQPSCCSV